MMKKITAILISLVFVHFFSHATEWNDRRIDELNNEALTAINLFIDKDKNSSLYQLLNADEIQKLRSQVDSKEAVFSDIVDKIILLLNKKYLYSQSLAYVVLRHKLYDTPESAIDLYESLLRFDDDASIYAFSKLDKLFSDKKMLERRKKLYRDHGFVLENVELINQQDYPEVCLKFTKVVRPEPKQNWSDLVKIFPSPRKALSYKRRDLCFIGDWQTRYEITVDQQLQSENQLQLFEKNKEITYTGDRPAMMRFATNGYILDESKQKNLPLSTANIDNVKVTLWQIPANNLSNENIQKLIESPQSLYVWRLKKILSREAETIFSGHFKVGKYKTNETVTTNISLDDLVKDAPKKSGIYVLVAENADTHEESAQIAFSMTNAGLSAYVTKEGLWTELRNINTAQPLVDKTVTLYSMNNSVLGVSKTNKQGVAKFSKSQVVGKQGLKPSHVMSEEGNFFAYLNINEVPIDLSDKGLSGVVDNAPLRSWIWADRGIYRPNDTAHLMWLLKTLDGKAFNSTPIWLELIRPDGKTLLEKSVKADQSGSYSFDYYFDHTAPQGNWTVRLSMGRKGVWLASKTLPVGAIAPQQIETKIIPIASPIRAEQSFDVSVQADWLYGAPAVNLSAYVEKEVSEREISDEAWQGWQIGLHDEKQYSFSQRLDSQKTNSKGRVSFSLNTRNLAFSTKPLALKLTAGVTEASGREVKTKYNKSINRTAPYIAIKNKAAKVVQLALINDLGELQKGEAEWQLYRVKHDYYWYKEGQRWQYQANESRHLFTTGKVHFTNEKKSQITLPVDDGLWVLSVRGTNAETAASIPLEFGYYAEGSKGSAPDRVQLTSDKVRYRDGEAIKLHLTAPFDGKASVKLAHRDSIIENYLVEFSNGKAELSFDWNKEWDDGLWLLASAWNTGQDYVHNRRAVGLHWIGGDLTPYKLSVETKLPEKITPKTQLTIPLTLSQEQKHGAVWARVAVIDEGLYQLAEASFSNPLEQFWSKKQLDAAFYDTWGDIIEQTQNRQASLRNGADGMRSSHELKALPELDLQLVTYWSKPVKFDASGQASITMDVPQFNGRLRVMAVVWDEKKLGAIEKTLRVRAPLVATLYTPPYLSPNDQSLLRVRLHNSTEQGMTIIPSVITEALTFKDTTEQAQAITLAPNEETWLTRKIYLSNEQTKDRAKVTVNITGDVSIQLEKFMDIRPQYAPRKMRHFTLIGAKKTAELKPMGQGQLLEREFFLSTNVPFDLQNILTQLSHYPYGCNEQITSKSWNNLLVNRLIEKFNLDESYWGTITERQNNLQKAYRALAQRQSLSGGFSLWSDGSSSDLWLTAYVVEFLLDSEKSGVLVNHLTLKRSLNHLRQQVTNNSEQTTAMAYAHYVLAKAGESVQGATSRFAESMLKEDGDLALSSATLHTVAALVNHGEMTLAERLLRQANSRGYQASFYEPYENYGSKLRNIAQSLHLLYELQAQFMQINSKHKILEATQEAMAILLPELTEALRHKTDYSTQELHWLAALADYLPGKGSKTKIIVDGQAVNVDNVLRLKKIKDTPIEITNEGEVPIYVMQNDWRIPKKSQEIENGYRLSMRYEDTNGNPIDIQQLKQNQQIVAIAQIEVDKEHKNADILFVYPLPAGLALQEYDIQKVKNKNNDWYNKLISPSFSENRDDRHIAAFNLSEAALDDSGKLNHVFMLRAVRKGVWHAPEYSVEDMYQPQFKAVHAMPTVTVD